MLLDGSADADRRAESMLTWDVENGVARRAWARNEGALDTIRLAMARQPDLVVTLPEQVSDEDLMRYVGGV